MNSRGFVFLGLAVVVLVVVVGISAFTFFSKSNQNEYSDNQPDPTVTPKAEEEVTVPGTIRLEAKDGILTNQNEYDFSTYLAETSRGFEAYLADKDAQVTIPFTITADQVGSYVVWIYTSDDGIFNDGERNATFFFDASQKLLYQHKSKDTQGMVWLSIGTVTLSEGDHFVQVTKRETTYAAFSFTSIKLVPIE